MRDAIRDCRLIFKSGNRYGVYVTLYIFNKMRGSLDDLVLPFRVVQTISFIRREKGVKARGIEPDELVVLNDERVLQIVKRITGTALVGSMKLQIKPLGYDSEEAEDEVYTRPSYSMSKFVQNNIGHIKGCGKWKEITENDVLFSLASEYRVRLNITEYKELDEKIDDTDYLLKIMGYEELVNEWVNKGEIDIEQIIDSMKGTKIKNNGYYTDYCLYLSSSLTNDRDLWLRNYCEAYEDKDKETGSIEMLTRYNAIGKGVLDYYLVINKESKEWLRKKLLMESEDETELTYGISGIELIMAIDKLLNMSDKLNGGLESFIKIEGLKEEGIYIGDSTTKLLNNIRNNKLISNTELIQRIRREKGKCVFMNRTRLSEIKMTFDKDMQISDMDVKYEKAFEDRQGLPAVKVGCEWERELKRYWIKNN